MLEKIVGSETKFSLQHRILNSAVFLGGVLSGIALITNILIGLYWASRILTFTGVILFFSLHYYSLRTGKSNFVAILGLGFLVLVFSPMMWFSNGGTMGGFQYYILFFIVGIQIATSGKIKWTLLSLMVLVTISLIIIEYFYPNLIVHYDNKEDRYIDIIISIFIAIGGIIIYTGIYFKQYESANNKLEIKNQLLEKSRKEIFAHKEKIEAQKNEIELKAKSLEDLNKTKDRLFSIISHDLKNSFFSVMGLSKILADPENEDSEEKKLETAQMLNNSSKKLYTFLENLLSWARVQRGEIEFEPKENNFYEIVAEVIYLFNPKAKQSGIDLTHNIGEDTPIYCDQNMTKTVLRNLVSNALNFTPKGGSVVIDSKNNDDEVIISVTDTGVGISEKNLSKLLKIDSKYIGTNTLGEKGTGLGLILCKEFVEKHNGNIWIESELGKGSRFVFTLPQKEMKN